MHPSTPSIAILHSLIFHSPSLNLTHKLFLSLSLFIKLFLFLSLFLTNCFFLSLSFIDSFFLSLSYRLFLSPINSFSHPQTLSLSHFHHVKSLSTFIYPLLCFLSPSIPISPRIFFFRTFNSLNLPLSFSLNSITVSSILPLWCPFYSFNPPSPLHIFSYSK